MSKSAELIQEYQKAIRSMREGHFDQSVPVDPNDEIGKLGLDLNDLARELERKFNEVNKLHEISDRVIAGLFLDDVLNRIYDTFHTVIPYNRMGCALLSDENKTAIAYWGRTDAPNVSIRIGYSAAMDGSSLQNIIDTGQPRILNDLETYLEEHPTSVSTKLLVFEGMRSNFTCPLIAQGKPVGFLFFTSTEKNTYQDIHRGIFMQIAEQISVLIEKSRMYQQLYELNQKLLLAQRELQHQATHDALTGVFNHGAIIEHLEAQLSRARRQHLPLSVIMIDVDHFKQFNDTYGHLAGDAMLKIIATRMSECLREYDYIGRYGGEEFLVVLGDANCATAEKTAERLNQAIGSGTVAFGDKLLAATISLGVVSSENCALLTTDQLITAADHGLYNAKAKGRNRIEICQI